MMEKVDMIIVAVPVSVGPLLLAPKGQGTVLLGLVAGVLGLLEEQTLQRAASCND